MKIRLLDIYGRVYGEFQRSLWKLQYYFVRSKKSDYPEKNPDIHGLTLIIVPHADDELIGCYAFLKRNAQNVVLFYCGFCGSNYDKDNQEIRRSEFISFANSLGIRYIISTKEVDKCLQEAVLKESPSNIFLTSIVDWHSEHRQVNFILSEILTNSSLNFKIGLYSISVPLPLAYRNYQTEYGTSEFRQKWASFESFYQSQASINVNRFKMYSRFTFSDSYASEPFYIIDSFNYISSIKKIKETGFNFAVLKRYLHNYYKISDVSFMLYRKFFERDEK